MKNNILLNNLRKQAYRFYPYGVHDRNPNYEKSSAYTQLKKYKAKQVKLLTVNWNNLVVELSDWSSFYNIEVEDWQETLPVDHCFKLVVILNENYEKLENRMRLVLNLSTLVPYFVIHQSVYTPESGKIHQGRYSAVAYDIPEEFKYLYILVCTVLIKHFPLYTELKKEIFQASVEGIFYQGQGDISLNDLPALNPLSIFDALFSLKLL